MGRKEEIGKDEMLVKLGKNGAALGDGLAPLIPIARPDNGARTERGEVTLPGLSRAERLNRGPNSRKSHFSLTPSSIISLEPITYHP